METLQVERTNGVVTVTMDRPEVKNAVNVTMWSELLETFRATGRSTDDRALVLTGAGGAFSSGGDVSDTSHEGTAMTPLAAMRLVGEVAVALHRLPVPSIAKVTGVAVGAGMNLALGCDLVVATPEARFSEIFHRRGFSIDCGGSWLLPRLIGMQRAKELALFGETVSAEEAASLGLVNRVVPASDIDEVVSQWATRLASGPTIAVGLTKKLLNEAFSGSLEAAVENEARAQIVNAGTHDTGEAMSAFLEGREPRFQGR